MWDPCSYLHFLSILVAFTSNLNFVTCGIFDEKLHPPNKMTFSLSPIYYYRLASREVEIYKELKQHVNMTRSTPHPLLVTYLTDYEDCLGQGGQEDWKVWEHPWKIYRMVWRFVHKITPLLEHWSQSGDEREVTLSAQLLGSDSLSYPYDDRSMLMVTSVGILNIQHVFDLQAAEMSKGKFGNFETRLGLTPFQTVEFINTSCRYDLYIYTKDWLDVLEKEHKNEIRPDDLKFLQEELILFHDVAFYNRSQSAKGPGPFIFSKPLSSGPSEALKHKELKEFHDYSISSGLQRDRMIKLLGLCSNSPILESTLRRTRSNPKLNCYNDNRKHPYFTISPLKTELVSSSPNIFMYHDILRPEAIQLIELLSAEQLLASAARPWAYVDDGTGFAWLEKETLPPQLNLVLKLEQALGLNIAGDAADDFRITLYHLGGDSVVHHDAYRVPNLNATTLFADRIATILIYLSDVALGGETVFPDLNLVVKPVKGSMLYWENYHNDGKLDWRTYHAPCPPALGYKLLASTFISRTHNVFTRPCGQRPSNLNHNA